MYTTIAYIIKVRKSYMKKGLFYFKCFDDILKKLSVM